MNTAMVHAGRPNICRGSGWLRRTVERRAHSYALKDCSNAAGVSRGGAVAAPSLGGPQEETGARSVQMGGCTLTAAIADASRSLRPSAFANPDAPIPEVSLFRAGASSILPTFSVFASEPDLKSGRDDSPSKVNKSDFFWNPFRVARGSPFSTKMVGTTWFLLLPKPTQEAPLRRCIACRRFRALYWAH